jgi:5'-nucleotidase
MDDVLAKMGPAGGYCVVGLLRCPTHPYHRLRPGAAKEVRMSGSFHPLSRILVTNDDGIDAPGLAVAIEVAESLAKEVWVSAPLHDCSGMSRSLSLQHPLRVHRRSERQIAVDGTPGDSAIVGLRHLMRDNPPDLVLSGVNAGANLSKEAHYSGTVGAAITARLLGVPAVALSQNWITRANLPWDTSRHWLPIVIRQLLETGGWPEDVVPNINVPNVSSDEVTGIESARLSMEYFIDIDVDRRLDHREHEYFWVNFVREQRPGAADSDVEVLLRNAISVTPIGLDQTHHDYREALAKALA